MNQDRRSNPLEIHRLQRLRILLIQPKTSCSPRRCHRFPIPTLPCIILIFRRLLPDTREAPIQQQLTKQDHQAQDLLPIIHTTHLLLLDNTNSHSSKVTVAAKDHKHPQIPLKQLGDNLATLHRVRVTVTALACPVCLLCILFPCSHMRSLLNREKLHNNMSMRSNSSRQNRTDIIVP